jgi:GNAT superfamily N-acetyltransferase
MQRMIEGFPSTCLRPVTKNDIEPPVAWILSYPYGALGPLHVLDEYRRKGLGSWLVLSLCEFMRSLAVREGHPCPRIYAFVLQDNVASASMFEKLSNWRRIDETVCWLSFIKV